MFMIYFFLPINYSLRVPFERKKKSVVRIVIPFPHSCGVEFQHDAFVGSSVQVKVIRLYVRDANSEASHFNTSIFAQGIENRLGTTESSVFEQTAIYCIFGRNS